mgnify:FL=1
MKTLQRWFSRCGALPLTCYLVAVALWLVLGAVHWGSDALARSAGTMYETDIPVSDWKLAGLTETAATPESAALTTTDGDPQMILEDVSDMVVRTVSYTVEFDGDAREMCLYYTTKVGEDYSQDRRVFPESLGDGRYLYTLPRTSIVALRLDPCSPDANKTVGLTFTPGTISLNAPETLPAVWQYFVPTWYQAFCLVLYPALAAAALSWLRDLVSALRRKTA